MAHSDLTVEIDRLGEPAHTIDYTAAMCGETLAGAAWLTRHDAGCEDYCSRVAVVCLNSLEHAARSIAP
ncbi:hypothetical protein [Actinoplanes regularis]|uniref:Uncharacterized protein n=1 Tax=Actinoplanes regularis TaxID=52697 RepID=A0A239BHU8_9ACTN|nr:hypothetical protein [Actinoplanes regularis]GIE88010.1 hypothetical protein Are01nite_44900 [Actinoplanes regularis]SNS07259.1 hypothetical protein SAMN06264365_109215 [Actinoplanes regularis]